MRHRQGIVGHRPMIPLLHDAVPMILGVRLEPDRRRAGAEQAERVRVRDETSARGQDRGGTPCDDVLQRLHFETTVVLLAMELEDLGEGQTCGLLDAGIELDERDLEPRRKRVADRALPRPANSEERQKLHSEPRFRLGVRK